VIAEKHPAPTIRRLLGWKNCALRPRAGILTAAHSADDCAHRPGEMKTKEPADGGQ
jgi:hypothetical protein